MANKAGKEGVSLLRAILALGRRMRAERPAGSVTFASLGILGTLARLGPMPAARLATEERLQPQSLTRLIAALERDGLIARRRSPEDRRALIIALTEVGRKVLIDDLTARNAWLESAMASGLSETEREALAAAAAALYKLAHHDGGNSG